MWREHRLHRVPVFLWQSSAEALARKNVGALHGAVEPFQTHVHLVAQLVGTTHELRNELSSRRVWREAKIAGQD
jgi:hypothetical protein